MIRSTILKTISILSGLVMVPASFAQSDSGFNGRIMLVSKLDEPDGLCLDIMGPAHSPRLDWAASIHTCHPEPLLDQIYDFGPQTAGEIKSAIPDLNICLSADSAEPESELHYLNCDEGDAALQEFSYLPNAQLQLTSTAASETPLCLAAVSTGPLPFKEAVEGEDPRGGSYAINPSRSHLMRALELQPCDKIGLEMSQFEGYKERTPAQFRRLD